jgi:hypothetical protein
MSGEDWKDIVIKAYRREGSLRATGAAMEISHVRVLQILRERNEYVHPQGGTRSKKIVV